MNLRKILFEPKAFDQLKQWIKEDQKVSKKILA